MTRLYVSLCGLLMLPALAITALPVSATDKKPADRGNLGTDYAATARKIIDTTLAGNDAWNKLEELCDDIGHRLSGSPQLEKAVEWALRRLREDGQENVRAEPVKVPKWVRGRESLVMVSPREYELTMIGLGMSVGTPPEGITAGVIVVADENELEKVGEKARGRFVLFNNPMPTYDPEKGSGYGTAVRFRHRGAQLAAKHGAVGCLVRSVTARSMRTPHTGAMSYGDAQVKVPAAAISIEDAELLSRLARREKEVRLTLKMQARDEGMVDSANVVAELRGREKPEEIVVIGGHLDAWDVGDGAHDDGAGCVMAMEAINVLRKLKLIPRRTIRVVLWTNEENGLEGAKEYARRHADDLHNHVAAIEADSGCFAPRGLSIECNDPERTEKAAHQLDAILRLLEPLGPMKTSRGWSGADIGPMRPAGVMLMGFMVEGDKYFDYHHSPADTLDKVDPEDLSKCVAAMAVAAYVIADMPDRLGGLPAKISAAPYVDDEAGHGH